MSFLIRLDQKKFLDTFKEGYDIWERFWSYVKKTDNCWIWLSTKNKDDYGQISLWGLQQSAHTLSYLYHNRSIDINLQVCHSCDNPSCLNWDHLFQATNHQNAIDSALKGRRGKLSIEDIQSIRNLFRDRKHTQKQLANMFNVHPTHISRIISKERRGYV